MAWVHTWCGLAAGWLLFVMFVTGAIGYYRHELTRWMTPEVWALPFDANREAAVAALAERVLGERAPGADEWTIVLPDARNPLLRVSARSSVPGGELPEAVLDPRTGRPFVPAPRATRGGDFLYRLHFDLYFISPILARLVVGLCGVLLFVALVSGLVVHRGILRWPMRLRLGGPRGVWFDAHNVTGILLLPFHAAVAYSGLVCLMMLLLPWGVLSVYGTAGLGAFVTDSFPQPPVSSAAAGPATTVPLERLVAAAAQRWGQGRAGVIAVSHPRDRRARVEITETVRGVLSFRKPGLLYDGVSGALVAPINASLSTVEALQSDVFGFHVAHFAGPAVRLVLFLFGLLGAVMIATGCTLWVDRRVPRHGGVDGDRVGGRMRRAVDATNAGIICGLPLAIGAYLGINRLLPPEWAGRAGFEVGAFFSAWAVALVVAHGVPPERRWPTLAGSAGAVLLCALLISLCCDETPRTTAWALSTAVLVIDGCLLVAGAAFLGGSWRSPRRRAAPVRPDLP